MNITVGFGNIEKTKRDYKGKSIVDFPEDYIVFDIETTGLDSFFNEIIEIGAIKYHWNKPIDKFHSLIKPDDEIDEFITELTGITNEMVNNSPRINKVLPLFVEFVGDGILVGHNVNFDINFVYDEMMKYNIGYLSNDYIDTLRISRKLLPNLKHHRLDDLTEYYKINANGHHRAMRDVEITNELFIKLKKEMSNSFSNIDEFRSSFNSHKNRIKFSEIKANIEILDSDNPFFEKNVAITGTLEKMQRKEAMQIIANLGGICQDGVNKETNYLILGNNDYNPQLRGEKSNKLIKAENLKLKGNDIEIISENVFYEVLNDYDML